jgi:hypothetical protein
MFSSARGPQPCNGPASSRTGGPFTRNPYMGDQPMNPVPEVYRDLVTWCGVL